MCGFLTCPVEAMSAVDDNVLDFVVLSFLVSLHALHKLLSFEFQHLKAEFIDYFGIGHLIPTSTPDLHYTDSALPLDWQTSYVWAPVLVVLPAL